MKVVLRNCIGIVVLLGATAIASPAQVATVASHQVTIRRLSETRSYSPSRIEAAAPEAVGALEVLQVRSNERQIKVVVSLFEFVRDAGEDGLARHVWSERSRQFYSAESHIRPRRLQTLTLAQLSPSAPSAINPRDADRQTVVLTITS